jgi:hypothetical protein
MKNEPAPTEPAFTPEDEHHLALYLAVLTARANGQTDPEIARDVFDIDPILEPDRARDTVEAFYRRACQIAEPSKLRQIASGAPTVVPKG